MNLIYGETATTADYVDLIDSARVYDIARVTSLDRMRRLSDAFGANIYLKREDTQEVHSFKIRGAYNKMCRLSKGDLVQGVLAASAGNHAQGVALKKTVKRGETAAAIVSGANMNFISLCFVSSDSFLARIRDDILADGRIDIDEARRVMKMIDVSFTPTEPCSRLIGLLRESVASGTVTAEQSQSIARAIDETINFSMTTAEERRMLMG